MARSPTARRTTAVPVASVVTHTALPAATPATRRPCALAEPAAPAPWAAAKMAAHEAMVAGIRGRGPERGEKGSGRAGDVSLHLLRAPHPDRAPQRPGAEPQQHRRAHQAAGQSQGGHSQERGRPGRPQGGVEPVDDGDAGADGQADGPAAAERRADEEERHRPELEGDEEAQAEAHDGGVHRQSGSLGGGRRLFASCVLARTMRNANGMPQKMP